MYRLLNADCISEKERKGKRLKIPPLLALLIIFVVMALPVVHAVEENDEVYLLDLPQKFADAFNIPLFPAQIFTTGIIMMIFMLPIAIWSKSIVPPIFVGFIVMGLCVALAWLPVWFLVVTAMLVALMFAGKMRDMISGSA
jgi:uncharacterized Tic20 family protein